MQESHGRVVELPEPSLRDLVRVALEDTQTLLRTELEIAKVDAIRILKLAALGLVVLTATGVLLALAVSWSLAALVLAAGGSTVQALLTSASVSGAIACGALAWLWLRQRKPAEPETVRAAS